MCEKLDICHLTDFRGRPDEGKRHFSIWPSLTFTEQKVDLVGIRRVFVFLPRGENRKTAIDTLGHCPQCGFSLVMAWTRVQLRVCRIRSLQPFCTIRLDDFGLGHPGIWIS